MEEKISNSAFCAASIENFNEGMLCTKRKNHESRNPITWNLPLYEIRETSLFINMSSEVNEFVENGK